MNICPVTLPMMLDARERRQMIQTRLLREHRGCLVCLTMNIAGDIKDTPAVRYVFSHGVHLINTSLGAPACLEYTLGPTGREAFFVYAAPAYEIKAKTVKIEEIPGIGRLFDIDVLDENGDKLSRGHERRCIVCGGPVTVCSRSREHGLSTIKEATNRILDDFIAPDLAKRTVSALYREVHLTPKPGLVDEANSGAHADMDISTFEKSAKCLEPFFEKAVYCGIVNTNCFSELNAIGQKAEAAMLAATGGINTHKGAIYSLLILLGAIGASLHRGGDIFAYAKKISEADTRACCGDTHGEDVLRKYGAKGARGEAQNGFESARMAYNAAKSGGWYNALLNLMAYVPDTNVLYRGGEASLTFLQSESRRILKLPEDLRKEAISELDRKCCEMNISPGGCADMLAMAMLLRDTEVLFED